MSRRRSLSTKQRVECFDAAGGVCHVCGVKIEAGTAWDVEHVIALEAGGDDVPENRRPVHRKICHERKTALDHKTGARIKRIRASHIGAKAPSRNPIPGGKQSPWKRKFDGTVVARD